MSGDSGSREGALTLPRVGNAIVSAVADNFARHPVRNWSCLSLYIGGLLLAFAFQGFAASPAAEALYEQELPSFSLRRAVSEAASAEYAARQEYHASRGWFWSCPAPACTVARARHESAAADLAAAKADVVGAQKRANAHVGLFSTHAVGEAKALFLETAESGKKFAVRASWWDILWSVLFNGVRFTTRGGSDDEGLMGLLVDIVLRITSNVIIAIAGTFVGFAFTVNSTISMFSTSWGESLLFFFGAIVAALAVSVTACCLCCGCTAGVLAVPVVVALNARTARIGGGDEAGRGRYSRRLD